MAAMEKEYETQKVPRVKGPEKGKQRGKKKKNSECARAKKVQILAHARAPN